MSDDPISDKIKTLVDEFVNYKGPPDDIIPLKKLEEIGAIDHPAAVKFLMGDGSMDNFMWRDIYEYQIIAHAFAAYLQRGELEDELLQEVGDKLVEISKAPDEKWGVARSKYARDLVKILKKENNPWVTYKH